MKKLIYLIVLALILGLVLTGCLLSNVGQVPTTEQSKLDGIIKTNGTYTGPVTLWAGQNIDVGTVEVWNDDEKLCVKYQLDQDALADGWLIYETHLAVATSLDGIPTNKSGNPQPGQFPYGEEGLGGVGMWPDEPLCLSLEDLGVGAECDQELYIAAHAKIMRPIEDCWDEVWQIGDVEVVNATTGWLENYADEFNWGDPAGPTTPGPNLGVVEPGFTNPFIVGGLTPTLISEFPYNSNFVRGYATDFDVQWEGSLPLGGLLTISWSPGQSASEKKVVSEDGNILAILTALGESKPGEGWFMNKYPLVEDEVEVGSLLNGLHTINFQHTEGDGTFWDWIRLDKPCVQEETAWGAGPRFVEKGNWATYFTYIVEGWEETLAIPADVAGEAGRITSTHSLTAGHTYQFVASGTCFWRNEFHSGGYLADAEYWLRNDSHGTGWTEMDPGSIAIWDGIAAVNIDWGELDATDHIYTIEYTPSVDSPMTFYFYDDQYNDNSGSLTLKIYSCF